MIFVNDNLDISTTKSTTRQLAGSIMPTLKQTLTQDEWQDMKADVDFFGDWDLSELSQKDFNTVVTELAKSDNVIQMSVIEHLKTDKRFVGI